MFPARETQGGRWGWKGGGKIANFEATQAGAEQMFMETLRWRCLNIAFFFSEHLGNKEPNPKWDESRKRQS